MKVVISIGGSLLTKEISYRNFKKYANVINEISRKHKVIVVCGGGSIARIYQKIGKKAKANNEMLDFIGIMATHLNASAFSTLIKNSYLIKWKSLKEAEKEVKKLFGRKVLVCAGYDVGCSTDYDAAYFASLINADLIINATNVDGIYDKDPNKYKDARKIKKISYNELVKIISKIPQKPGEYRLFDLKALEILKKKKIKLIVVNGKKPSEILKAIEGRHSGSEVF
ncbi:MAG: UMP kinase [Candidatus Aenigmatarchaeota archaeon]